MNEQEKYVVRMHCSNCSQQVNMSFPRGKEVPRRASCPTCGCYTLSRVYVQASQCSDGWSMAKWMDVFFNGRKA